MATEFEAGIVFKDTTGDHKFDTVMKDTTGDGKLVLFFVEPSAVSHIRSEGPVKKRALSWNARHHSAMNLQRV